MRFTGIYFKKTTNPLLGAIQNFCARLIEAPEENGIADIDILQQKVSVFIQEQKRKYPRFKSELTSELNSYQTFQMLNLTHGKDKIFIQLSSRRTEYEKAFEAYDNVRASIKFYG